MKKDILLREVTDVGLACVPLEDGKIGEGALWELYLVNLKQTPLEQVIINATGKGVEGQEGKSTATLRYYVPQVAAESFVLIEAIVPEVLTIQNKYWLSFRHGEYLYDKQYTLEPEPGKSKEFWIIPLMGKLGIWME